MRRTPAADRLAPLLQGLLGAAPPYRLRAWDGSETGAADAPATVVLHSRRALRTLLWQPDELGLARAYVAGDLDIEGDIYAALDSPELVEQLAGNDGLTLTTGAKLAALRTLLRLGAVGRRPPLPPEEIVRPRGVGRLLHTAQSDAAAVSHHYDAGNAFYELLLDASMAYSSGYWTTEEGLTGPADAAGLARSQHDKLELICRKLDLAPGRRLLDIGCGWGSLAIHAAREHGAQVRAVTISREQRDHVTKRIRDEGLADRVQVDLLDYRDIATRITGADGAQPFDAVSSIEMGEHVGDENYPTFVATIFGALRPGGRALIQQMSRGANAPGGGAFIETYVTPDMVMRPVGDTLTFVERAGLEVRDVHVMREHYVPTIRAWLAALEARFDEAAGLVGESGARMWRLYLVGGALAFEENRMGVDQILAVRPTATGRSQTPATRDDWSVDAPARENR